MKFQNFLYFNKTALIIAIEKENTDIIKMLLKNPKIDTNIKLIFIGFVFMSFQLISFLITF